uniref:Chymotrypsin-1-like n=1 Tax=Tineola bisselliella TaxID=93883 RepID=A0A891XHE2_TINBI|nr:chymotrypsin-1-like [Tineola bisselliella]
MKAALAFVLLAVAAVHGRSTALEGEASSTGLANLGENPWLVHLRIAVSTSGFLNTCGGSLIHENWVVTSSSCITDSRFIWVRFGLVTVWNPELVTETSTVVVHPNFNANNLDNNIGLINTIRVIHTSANIRPIGIIGFNTPPEAFFCGFGARDNNNAGEQLRCFDLNISRIGIHITGTAIGGEPTRFDVGGGLINGNLLVGMYSHANADGTFAYACSACYRHWIEGITGPL